MVPLLLAWFEKNARDLPWRKTSDPYAIWISEIMLQQTQVKTVIPFWERWMRELPNVQSLAQAPTEKILKLWEGLGYYTRVHNAQKAAQQIVEKFSAKFPNNFDDVLALPGIGRYTAGAICSIAFNQAKPILDGNVIRVLTRIFGIAENPREKIANAKLWRLAGELVSCAARKNQPNNCSHLNQSLMELGALVCTPREPKCPSCPLKKNCVAFSEQRVNELPNLAQRATPTQRHFAAFVVAKRGHFLVRQRPAGAVNAHLWEFPNVELPSGEKNFSALAKPFCVEKNSAPFHALKHSITRYRISLRAFHAELPKNFSDEHNLGIWKTPAELNQLAFTSAHRKILRALICEK